MGHGVSTPRDLGYAESQDLTELDSIFSNRNVTASKSKKGRVNPVNPLETETLFHAKSCASKIDPAYSRETNPSSNYRGMEVNRFVNVHRNPQNIIFENFSVNTRLEAADNYSPDVPQPWPELAGPRPRADDKHDACSFDCNGNVMSCPEGWKK